MTAEPISSTIPDTIVLIHGLWMTARVWERWVEYYRLPGYAVLAPAYPGLDEDVEALRDDSTPIERLTISETADHYEAIIRGLDSPPIMIGHCFGGVLVQLMLDRGLGAAGVAIHSVPVHGVDFPSLPDIGAHLPSIAPPSNGPRAVALTVDQFRYAFMNGSTSEETRAAYERYHVPAPSRILWDGILDNIDPQSATAVDFAKPDRAPLLFIAGTADRLTPASVNRANYERYAIASSAVVGFAEFPGRAHFTLGEAGWQDVADYALGWAEHPSPDGQLARSIMSATP